MQRGFFTFFLWLSAIYSQAQLPPEVALLKLDAQYPQEKLHLFFNRESYVAGETIWFKSYVFSGNVLSYISTNLHVELYNEKKDLVTKGLFPLVNAIGQGNLQLPDSLPEGNYFVRAYTPWMLNFDPRFQYIYELAVYNTHSAMRLAEWPVQWSATVNPESGTLLTDEENKVVVRLDTRGKLPLTWSGFVINTKNPKQKLVTFRSLNPQLASFLLTPETGNVYEVHISDEDGNTSVVKMMPKEKGIVIRAEQIGSEVYVDLIFKGISSGGKGYKLVAQMQNQLVQSSVIRKPVSVVRASIPMEKLMQGILHISLFDPDNNFVAERLIFIQRSSDTQGSARFIEAGVGNKEEWSLLLDSGDYSNYAVSVVAGNDQRKRNIYSDLWFGDLSSRIHLPADYFDPLKEEAAIAIDALMVTEKWTRFSWEDILANRFPSISIQPEKYLAFTGVATINGKPFQNEVLSLMFRFSDSTLQFKEVTTNNNGEFFLQNVAFYDTLTVFYQPGKGKSRNVTINFIQQNQGDREFSFELPLSSMQLIPRLATDSIPAFVGGITRDLLGKIKSEDDRYEELTEVRVEKERKTAAAKLNEQLASPLFRTQSEINFDFINEEQGIQSYAHIMDWLDGRVAGLSFRIKMEEEESPFASGTIIRQRIPMMRDREVSVFIDEMPTDLEAIYMLPTSEIAMVKVIKGYFLGANSGGAGGGAIVVYTKRPRTPTSFISLPTGLLPGYSAPIHFKSNNKGNALQLFWETTFGPGETLIKISANPQLLHTVILTGFTKDAQPLYRKYKHH